MYIHLLVILTKTHVPPHSIAATSYFSSLVHLFACSLLHLFDRKQLTMAIKGRPQDLIVASAFVITLVDGKKVYIINFFTYIIIN